MVEVVYTNTKDEEFIEVFMYLAEAIDFLEMHSDEITQAKILLKGMKKR